MSELNVEQQMIAIGLVYGFSGAMVVTIIISIVSYINYKINPNSRKPSSYGGCR